MIERFERGEIRAARYADYDRGQGSIEGDTPGSTSSNDPMPRIKVMRVIKIEVEEDEEDNEIQRFIVTMIAAISLSIAIQWLFGKGTIKRKKFQLKSQTNQQKKVPMILI